MGSIYLDHDTTRQKKPHGRKCKVNAPPSVIRIPRKLGPRLWGQTQACHAPRRARRRPDGHAPERTGKQATPNQTNIGRPKILASADVLKGKPESPLRFSLCVRRRCASARPAARPSAGPFRTPPRPMGGVFISFGSCGNLALARHAKVLTWTCWKQMAFLINLPRVNHDPLRHRRAFCDFLRFPHDSLRGSVEVKRLDVFAVELAGQRSMHSLLAQGDVLRELAQRNFR